MNNGFPHQQRHSQQQQQRDNNLQPRRNGSQKSDQNGRHPRVRFPEENDDNNDNVDHPLAVVFTKLAGIFFGGVASICLLGVVTILAILYVVVRPFSVSTYRRVANQLAASSFLDAIALLLPNMRLYLTGDSDVPSPVGTSILVCNHLMDGDWWPLLMLGRCVGLRGSVKVFLRNEILNLSVNHSNNGGADGSSGSSNSGSNGPGHPTQRESQQSRRSGAQGKQIMTPNLLKQATAAIHNNNGYGSSGSEHNKNDNKNSQVANPSPTTSHGSTNNGFATRHTTSSDLKILAKLLHAFMEFPLLNGEDYISDREHLFQLLRSFAENTAAPVHLLFFPEGWSLHNGADRKNVLAMSNAFAKREGRPQLKHLLLPKTTGFNASLESLRESSPVVYDVTMAFTGYDGSLPPKFDLSFFSLWNLMRHSFPTEIHIRIKRYSMEEVLQDASWLDKKWAEKDRLLNFFSTHQSFPTDGRGFCRHRVFNTRSHSLEGSLIALARLLLMPWAIPFLLFLSIPLFWTVLWIYLIHRGFKIIFPDNDGDEQLSSSDEAGSRGIADQTPRSESANNTPFFPATPFASPSVSTWRDMLPKKNSNGNSK